MHKPLKGGFNNILAAVAMGNGSAKRAATKSGLDARAKASESKSKMKP